MESAQARPRDDVSRVAPLLPLTLGVAMTLALAGYRFGESNHAVYLLAALRQNDPGLLANDWWTRSTLQYHFVFNHLSAWLMRVGMIEQVFLAAYVGLAVLLHAGWRRLTLALGGDDRAYLASVILYHLMAAGTGLGMYHFLQDSSFLPSNVANVAMLWGVYFWIRGRLGWSGLWFGLAGLFHLNHALAGIGLWGGLTILAALRARRRRPPSPGTPGAGRGEGVSEVDQRISTPTSPHPNPLPEYRERGLAAWLIGTLLLLALSAPAIAPAVKSVLAKTASLPLAEFVALYVRLRHPHHYDPSSWPVALWLTFLLPIALALPAYRRMEREVPSEQLHRARHAFILFCGMLLLALIGAGILYLSEPLVQMSLYRFSIFPKLLSCVAAGWLVVRVGWAQVALRVLVMGMLLGLTGFVLAVDSSGRLPRFLVANAFPMWLFALLATAAVLRPRVLGWGRVLFGTMTAACVVISLVVSWPKLGIAHAGQRGDDAGYLEVCRWAAEHTPRDAVFVVPPDEQSFRLHGRRAIVVNFKNVPQLSGELGEWRDRLQNVLAIDDLRRLPQPFHRALDAIRSRYAELPADHLSRVAKQYGARYVVSVRRFDASALGTPVFSDSGGRYFLYDLEQSSGGAVNGSQASSLNVGNGDVFP